LNKPRGSIDAIQKTLLQDGELWTEKECGRETPHLHLPGMGGVGSRGKLVSRAKRSRIINLILCHAHPPHKPTKKKKKKTKKTTTQTPKAGTYQIDSGISTKDSTATRRKNTKKRKDLKDASREKKGRK